MKLEFLEGISSQEIDQLREELMDKEVEIDYLRKEQAYTQHYQPQLPPLHSVRKLLFYCSNVYSTCINFHFERSLEL